ncbi:hypothetical protein EFK07_23860 [Pseudomonas putida]|uniref:Uncharacterized protein n=2 Tax=Pseudomonas putida group TaxID=136845 RepID=A0ABX4TZS8_PSEDL|nr:hypothetical protein CXG44_04535 [Pseudomonas plecoglossicida]PLU93886.1 hypothetical protein CXG45_09905 [Pseudomonas plecoglossicida]PLV04640.1 hypothetical protein CXG48_09765 [Pseudomonas plecoglossicida]PLV13811.1 hypothetical protein CXG47_13455 [Pseudomonas plecoglossicida]RNF83036.1 hypothetical protein EFK07_23860 [Pseudomonas putida]
MPASSRVNPLPQVLHRIQAMRGTCGSGFTREEARTGNRAFRAVSGLPASWSRPMYCPSAPPGHATPGSGPRHGC